MNEKLTEGEGLSRKYFQRRNKQYQMLDLKLGLFSRSVLGSVNDPSTLSRKIAFLSKLGLVESTTRSLTLRTTDDVLALFRIVHFNAADLMICRDMERDEILRYKNPCNLRNALKSSLAVCGDTGLVVLCDELEMRLAKGFSGGFRNGPESSVSVSSRVPESFRTLLVGVGAMEGSNGYSMRAERSFNRRETVLSLDKDIPISILSVFRDPRFPGADLFEQGLHPDTIFLLFLIYLRDRAESLENLIHADFFGSQPKSYGTLFELPERIVALIDEPDLLHSVKEQNADLHAICASLQPAPDFSDLLWAKSLCTSRAFSLPLKPESDIEKRVIASCYPSGLITTILPVVHFLNHDFSAPLETPVVSGDGAVVVKSLVNITAGSELFLLYGGFTNKELMLNYGFFVSENPYDSFTTADGRLVRRGAISVASHASEDSISLPEVEDEYKSLVHGYLKDRAAFRALSPVSS